MTIAGGHEQVLVIDDDELIVTILETFLKLLGYRAFCTTSAAEALTMFLEKKDQISIVILDQSMPDISGTELALMLRGINADIPIIVCSGYDEEEMRHQTQNIGITAFMRKPVMYDQLARTVRQVLDSAQESYRRSPPT